MKHLIVLISAIACFTGSADTFFGPVVPRNTARAIIDQAVKEAKAYTDSKLSTNETDTVSADIAVLSNRIETVDAKFAEKLDKTEVFNASGLFETTYTNANGTVAKIFNEADGGGMQIIDGTTGVKAAVSVHSGGGDVGLYGQWYAIKEIDGKSVGTRITVTDTGAFYTVTNTYQWTAEDEIATLRQINELRAALDAAIQRIQALENK